MKNHKCLAATVGGGVGGDGGNDDVNGNGDAADNIVCNEVETAMDTLPSASLQIPTEDNPSLDPSYRSAVETNSSSGVPFPDGCSLPTSWTPS